MAATLNSLNSAMNSHRAAAAAQNRAYKTQPPSEWARYEAATKAAFSAYLALAEAASVAEWKAAHAAA